MFKKYTQQQVSDNQIYTQECDQIYHSFQIAEVRESRVREAAIPIFFSIFLALMIMAFIVCVVRIKVYGDMDGDNWLIFVYLYILIAAFVLSAAVWFGFSLSVRIKKDKNFHYYLYRDKNGLYFISVSTDAGKSEIIRIVNCDKLLDFDGVKKDNMSRWYPYKFERYSGIKQFVLSPKAVFSDTDESLIAYKHKLKKKVTRGNTVIYKFYSVQGLMVGARHRHCLVVKDGKIQYAVAHYMYKYSMDVGYFHRNYKHTYSHIDDDNIKIVFSRELIENAKKEKFDLPQPSVNIIYESAE